ncbi:succinate--CoA ligase [ADP-forming] subunit beta, mitochondrial-like isoform X2 [Panicum hallii]|uniref:succinate--CoA ligase [ADP-forming] subunit beta, mitochondrial-like isoform X2 n=1 Tax=Panicum hallii TaxID=206008 RepID=UPI000DF4CEEC|nr:succinate--CoA ligase [ADP-forming] subunit beta, mitochondrial-like isoform X2 [Panicum hallii]
MAASAASRLNIHEYQGAELMGKYGINAPRGATAGSAQEVKDALKNVFPNEKQATMPQLPYLMLFHLIHSVDAKCQPPVDRIVVKSQTLAGGRRLGTFKSGLNGGVHIVKAEEAEGLASAIMEILLI